MFCVKKIVYLFESFIFYNDYGAVDMSLVRWKGLHQKCVTWLEIGRFPNKWFSLQPRNLKICAHISQFLDFPRGNWISKHIFRTFSEYFMKSLNLMQKNWQKAKCEILQLNVKVFRGTGKSFRMSISLLSIIVLF